MILRSKYFPDLEVDERSLVYFPDGLLGFEGLRQYAAAELAEFRPFLWLVATDAPDLGFAVSDPALFYGSGYSLNLSDADKETLDLQTGDELMVFVIVSLGEGGRRITANLKGPVVLNRRNRMAKQVVIYNPAYSVHHPLLSVTEGGRPEPRVVEAGRLSARG